MKTLLTLVLLFSTTFVFAEPLPDMPIPTFSSSTTAIAAAPVTSVARPKLSAWDYAANAAVAITRVLDYTSTRAFLTPKAIYGCPACTKRAPGHEAILPAFVANNPAILATFEAGSIALSAYGEHRMVRLGHPRIARAIMFAQAGSTLYYVVNNYKIAGRTMYPIHFTSDAARPRTTVALER
jgi:hypothetical protein